MKVSPKSDYPVRVVPESEEHDGPESGLYEGIYLVLLNHEVPVYFVPDVSSLAPPWTEYGLPEAGDPPETVEQARLLTATFGRYAITPNEELAGTTERFVVRVDGDEDLHGVAFYVTRAEFSESVADLAELSELARESFPETPVSELRRYGVVHLLEARVVASGHLRPYHAALLGRGVSPPDLGRPTDHGSTRPDGRRG